jgi:hypothetical protein
MAIEFRAWTEFGVSLHTRTLWDVCRCKCHVYPNTSQGEGHQCCVKCPRCNYRIEDMESHQTYCIG